MKDICEILKIRTTPYHPQSDGVIECYNQILLSMLSTSVVNHLFHWQDMFKKVCMVYNTSVMFD